MGANVYIFAVRTGQGAAYKIGYTTRSVQARLAEIQYNGKANKDLQRQAKLILSVSLPFRIARILESRLHKRYSKKRFFGFEGSGKSEWFALYFPWFAFFLLIGFRFFYCALLLLFAIWQLFSIILTIKFFFFV